MNSRQTLQNIHEIIQQDQIFLTATLSTAMTASLRTLVTAHLRECMNMELEATSIAASRGWTAQDLPPGKKWMTTLLVKFQLMGLGRNHQIASALILHHTKSMIQVIANQHRTDGRDRRLCTLCQCYLDLLSDAVQQLQGFL